MEKLRQIIREEIKSILLEDLEQDLKSHDWYFNYSDDGRVYRKGAQELENILDQMKKMDSKEAQSLWNKYAPKVQKFPLGIYKSSVKKVVDDTSKYKKSYKKGDMVLVEGSETPGLYSRYLGKIVKELGWELRKGTNTYYAKYEIKIEKVYSKVDKQIEFEGKNVIAFDFNIKGKK